MAMQIRRTVNGGPPTGLAQGQLAVEMQPGNLWVGVPTSVDPSGRKLLNGQAQAARWLQGTTVPAPGTGVVGDWYINITNGQTYEKTGATTWTPRINFGALDLSIPTLEVSTINWGNYYTRLRIVSGRVQPGDRVYLLRESRSGPGWWYRHGHQFQPSWASYPCEMTRNGRWVMRKGFRHPADSSRPNWGNFNTYEWTNPYFNSGNYPIMEAGSFIDIRVDYREMMRMKNQHRRRGRELLKFVIARPINWGGQFRWWQIGDCTNTVVVRLHQHAPTGSYYRPTSVSIRP